MSKPSKKHHYLPQFYLRGFADANGSFIVYDKHLRLFRKSKPEHEFYEKFRNTVDFGGEDSLLVEEMYSHLESSLAPAIASIEKFDINQHNLTSDIIVRLKFFVETMRWRNPALDEIYSKLITRFSIDEFGLTVRGKNEERNREIEREMMSHPAVQKTLRPLMATFGLRDISNQDHDISKWHILYQDGGFPIIGDFPIIFNPRTVADFVNNEFVMPLSAQRTVIFADVKPQTQLPYQFTIDKDLAMIHLAKRFVCCKHEDYLRFMVNYYYEHLDKIDDSLLENLFSGLA
jgi:hypothetical protein